MLRSRLETARTKKVDEDYEDVENIEFAFEIEDYEYLEKLELEIEEMMKEEFHDY